MNILPTLSLGKQKAIQKLKQKKYRKIENAFICEGFRLFDAALRAAPTLIKEIVLSQSLLESGQGKYVIDICQKRKIPVYTAAIRTIQILSDEVTPAGLIFSVEKNVLTRQELSTAQQNIILYFDRITDPGNLGTLIRSAAWFGVPLLVLSPGCVDPFNPKAVRASAGAIFETAICTEIEFEWLHKHFKKNQYQFVATAASQGVATKKWQVAQKSLIFFGQEASGLNEKILQAADIHLTIPGAGKTESLNLSTAASIIMYEYFSRQTKI